VSFERHQVDVVERAPADIGGAAQHAVDVFGADQQRKGTAGIPGLGAAPDRLMRRAVDLDQPHPAVAIFGVGHDGFFAARMQRQFPKHEHAGGQGAAVQCIPTTDRG